MFKGHERQDAVECRPSTFMDYGFKKFSVPSHVAVSRRDYELNLAFSLFSEVKAIKKTAAVFAFIVLVLVKGSNRTGLEAAATHLFLNSSNTVWR